MSVIVKKQLSKELTEVEMKHKYTSSIHCTVTMSVRLCFYVNLTSKSVATSDVCPASDLEN